MLLPDLKNQLTAHQDPDLMLIFRCESDDFVAVQYIKALAEIRNASIVYVDSISKIPTIKSSTIFDDDVHIIYVCKAEFLESIDDTYIGRSDVCLVVKRIKKEAESSLSKYIIDIPKLEPWQIKDYLKITYKGFTDDQLDYLIDLCDVNMYRIIQEIDKVVIFPSSTRSQAFDNFRNDRIFGYKDTHTIFDLVTAIQRRDTEIISSILSNIANIDIESTGLVTLLYNNFRKLINVWLNKNPTPENTGLKSNQIYAINKLPRTFSSDQLERVFQLITGMDNKIKLGEIPENLIIDYLIVKIFTL